MQSLYSCQRSIRSEEQGLPPAVFADLNPQSPVSTIRAIQLPPLLQRPAFVASLLTAWQPSLLLRSSRRLVGVPGIEPGTSSLSGTRSNQLSYTPDLPKSGMPSRSRRAPFPSDTGPPSQQAAYGWATFALAMLVAKAGGGNRLRTGDLMLAKHVLYQLSYAPHMMPYGFRHPGHRPGAIELFE